MRRLTLQAEINTFTGYGLIITELVKGLERRGCYIALRAIKVCAPFGATIPLEVARKIVYGEQPEDFELLVHPPFQLPTPGKRTIYFSMWESTRLHDRSVKFLNQAEIVVVPCDWCARCFKESGVDRPIVVIPLGFDPEIFKPVPVNMDGPCVFGVAGRVVHGGPRKGVAQVIQCFRDAFTGNFDVRLHVKAHPDDPVTVFDDPRIRVTKAHFKDKELVEWLSRLTCFVSAAKGEGFGLWQLQSMAAGKPVIAPIYSGLAQFMRSESSYPVRFEEVPADGPYTGRGNWAAPDSKSMVEQMRRVYLERKEASLKGAQAVVDASSFTWDQCAEKMHGLLREVGAA